MFPRVRRKMSQRFIRSLLAAQMALLAVASIPSIAAPKRLHIEPALRSDSGYRFQTLDDPADPSNNVLTGINDAGVISGYYGGTKKHPSHGYTVAPPYGASNYTPVQIQHALQTEVLAIDNLGNIMGNYLFLDRAGHERSNSFVQWNGSVRTFE